MHRRYSLSTVTLPELAPSGTLSAHPPERIIAWCETVRFTGLLGFVDDNTAFELPFIAGQLEDTTDSTENPNDLSDPSQLLDRFLSLTDGSYTLIQRLPSLPDATEPTPLSRAGSLSQHSPSTLMAWCERVALDGQLSLSHNPLRCTARYDHGELVSLTLDGAATDSDISSVFAWENGTFSIQSVPLFPRESWDPSIILTPPRATDDLLRTVELALTDVLARRESVRPARTLHPSLRPQPLADPTLSSHTPPTNPLPQLSSPPRFDLPAGSADTTVKVYFVRARAPEPPPTPPTPPAVSPVTSAAQPTVSRSRPLELALWSVFALCTTIALIAVARLLLRA